MRRVLVAAVLFGLLILALVALGSYGGSTPHGLSKPGIHQVRAAPQHPLDSVAAPVVGEVFDATTGSWSGDPVNYTYQWEDCNANGANCSPVLSADGRDSSYTVINQDVGFTLEVVVTATNTQGSASKASAPTGIVTGGGGPSQFALTVSEIGNGTGAVISSPSGISCGAACSANFNSGTVVVLTATPDSGSLFSGWSGGGCSGTGTCQVTLSANTTVTASFSTNVAILGTGPSLAQCTGTCTTPTFNTTGAAITTTDSDPGGGNTPLSVTRYVFSAVPGNLVTNDASHPVPLVVTWNDGCPGVTSTKVASCFDNTGVTGDKGPYGWTQISATDKFIVLDLFANNSSGYDLATAYRPPIADNNCGSTGTAQCDQIPELVSAIQWAQSQWAIDPNRIFLTSGFFQNSLAIDATCDTRVEPLLAGVGTVSGVLGGQTTAHDSPPSAGGTCPALVDSSATNVPDPIAGAHPLMYEDVFSARDASNGTCTTPAGMPQDGVPVIPNDCLDGGGQTNKTPPGYEYSQDEINTLVVNPAFGCSSIPTSTTYPGDTFIKVRTYGNCTPNLANGVETQVVDYTELGCHNYGCNGIVGGNTGPSGGATAPSYVASLIWNFWTGAFAQSTGNPPVNQTAPSITGTAHEGNVLTCSPGTWSGDPPITYTYQWQRGGSNITGATSSTYTAALADVGSTLTCAVTATNNFGNASATSAATSAVTGIPPSGGTATITGTASDGSTLTANAGTWSGDPPITYTYQWKRGGTNIAGATNLTYVLTSADVGSIITVSVTATNNSGSAQSTSAGVGPVAAVAPANTGVPSISGSTVQGNVLTAANGTWSGTTPIAYTYQWKRGGTAISGATSSTYATVTADIGTNITVTVTATNTAGNALATSPAVGPITASGPVTCGTPKTVTLTKVARASGANANKGIFGPWMNHIVTTDNGNIYVAYLDVGNGSDVLGSWTLAVSTNGGASFTPVYTSGGTNWHHVDLETDGTNVYAVVNFHDTGAVENFDGYLFEFVPGSFGSPTQTKFTNAASSKFSAIYNPVKNQIDVGWWDAFGSNQKNFMVLNPTTGAVVKSVQVFTASNSSNVVSQYPNMALDPAGDIFFSWHTVDQNLAGQNYYDAHMLYSTDNGTTWNGPSGQVTIPVSSGSDGPSYEIVNTSDANEFIAKGAPGYGTGNWNVLDSVAYNNNALNFMYGGDSPTLHTSYAHLAWPGNTFSHRTDSWTSKDGTVLVDGENSLGAFSQDSSHTGTLYFVGAQSPGAGNEPVVLDSPDSGTTWCTYASTSTSFSPTTYMGAARFIDTVNGEVQGLFSSTVNSSSADIWFVHAPVSLP